MKTKPTKKKWSRTEWLLLLAPLLVVAGLALMNFAPQLSRAWREWREYGSNRPYAVLRLQTQNSNGKRSFTDLAFSPDGKQLAVTESERVPSSNPTSVVQLWHLGKGEPTFSWQSNSNSAQLRFLDKKTLSITNSQPVSPHKALFFAEKRDTENGHLLSRKQLNSWPTRDFPSYIWDQRMSIYGPRQWFCKYGKDDVSIEVSVRDTLMEWPKKHKEDATENYIKVNFFVDVTNKKQRSHRHFPLTSYNDPYLFRFSTADVPVSTSNFVLAFLPDLRFIFIWICESDLRIPDSPNRIRTEIFDTESQKKLWSQDRSFTLLAEIAFSSHGLLAIKVRDVPAANPSEARTRTEVRDIRTGLLYLTKEHDGNVYHEQMQFSPDGKLLAFPQDDRIELWDVSNLN